MYHQTNRNKSVAAALSGSLLTISGVMSQESMGQGLASYFRSPHKPSAAEEIPARDRLSTNLVFMGLSSENRERVVRTYESLNSSSRYYFLRILEKNIVNTKTPIVLQKDFFGETALSNIESICTSSHHPNYESNRQINISRLFDEILYPGDLNQSHWGVCGTGISFVLFKYYPAEALRLEKGLLSPEGEVELLQPGKKLIRPRSNLFFLPTEDQSLSEHLIFSAFMDFANGKDLEYCDICDRNFDIHTGELSKGLTPYQQKDLITALFNLKESECCVYDGKDSMEILEKQKMPGFYPLNLKWEEYPWPENSSADLHITNLAEKDCGQHFVAEENQVEARKKFPAPGTMMMGLHMINVTDIKDGRVYYHNLLDDGESSNGTRFEVPLRKEENSVERNQSSERAVILERMQGFIVPQKDHAIPEPRLRIEGLK
jgi:hypothetical protein